MSKNYPLPPPDMSDTDPDAVLRRRISIPDSTTPTPAYTPSRPSHTQEDPSPHQARKSKEGKRAQPDPVGMRRVSLYVTEEAADALETAAGQVLATLGGNTPRHLALSALLIAGADQTQPVTRHLAAQQATELTARLAALQQVNDT
ncbi:MULTISPECIES: hypothetical protein [unclassified Pseudonocardia]|uniref:hypothetical protein n=1 Tax=unclassified Pseudonocardia TaxID=2619320 RepID=UPI000ABC3EFE|nr:MULTISPECIES: hypothetical protein [unclassified Pseudonocardia]